MSDRFRKIIGVILLLVGVGGLGTNFIISYIGEKKSQELIDNFQWDMLIEPNDNVAEFEPLGTDENQEKDLFSSNVMAVLSIPKVNIRYPVIKGTDDVTLKKALGYFEETAMPGEVGNFAVAGHRNSSRAKYFNRLDEVQIGDEIIVETREEKFTYIVDNSFKIHESETNVLDQGDDKRITLITCTNGYKPKYRIVVQGYLKE